MKQLDLAAMETRVKQSAQKTTLEHQQMENQMKLLQLSQAVSQMDQAKKYIFSFSSQEGTQMTLSNEPVDIGKRRVFDDIWTTNKHLSSTSHYSDYGKKLLSLGVVFNHSEFKSYMDQLLGVSRESHNNSRVDKRLEMLGKLHKESGVYLFQTGPAYQYRFLSWNPSSDERFQAQIAQLAGNPRYVIHKGRLQQYYASDLWEPALYTDKLPAFMPYKLPSFEDDVGLDVQGTGYNNVRQFKHMSVAPTFLAYLVTDDPTIGLNDIRSRWFRLPRQHKGAGSIDRMLVIEDTVREIWRTRDSIPVSKSTSVCLPPTTSSIWWFQWAPLLNTRTSTKETQTRNCRRPTW